MGVIKCHPKDNFADGNLNFPTSNFDASFLVIPKQVYIQSSQPTLRSENSVTLSNAIIELVSIVDVRCQSRHGEFPYRNSNPLNRKVWKLNLIIVKRDIRNPMHVERNFVSPCYIVKLVGVLSELAEYCLSRGQYEKGVRFLLDGMRKSIIINDERSILRYRIIVERYQKFVLTEAKTEYHNLESYARRLSY